MSFTQCYICGEEKPSSELKRVIDNGIKYACRTKECEELKRMKEEEAIKKKMEETRLKRELREKKFIEVNGDHILKHKDDFFYAERQFRDTYSRVVDPIRGVIYKTHFNDGITKYDICQFQQLTENDRKNIEKWLENHPEFNECPEINEESDDDSETSSYVCIDDNAGECECECECNCCCESDDSDDTHTSPSSKSDVNESEETETETEKEVPTTHQTNNYTPSIPSTNDDCDDCNDYDDYGYECINDTMLIEPKYLVKYKVPRNFLENENYIVSEIFSHKTKLMNNYKPLQYISHCGIYYYLSELSGTWIRDENVIINQMNFMEYLRCDDPMRLHVFKKSNNGYIYVFSGYKSIDYIETFCKNKLKDYIKTIKEAIKPLMKLSEDIENFTFNLHNVSNIISNAENEYKNQYNCETNFKEMFEL